jgi:hypothetical protein
VLLRPDRSELAAGDPASPLFGAGNAGFTARDGRLHHRDDESRSQSFVDILARAGSAEVMGSAKARAIPPSRNPARSIRMVNQRRRPSGRP